MNAAVQDLKDWCLKERKSLLKGIELMEGGTFGTHYQSAGGPMTDTTATTLADYRQKVEEIDELLKKIEADHPEL